MKLRALLLSLVIASGSWMSLEAKPKNKVKTPKLHAASVRARKARNAKVKTAKVTRPKYKTARRAAKPRMHKQKKVRTV